jgi:hypothetical protein
MPAKQAEIFIGPEIPASNLTHTKYLDPAQIEAVKSITVGFARQTNMTRHQAWSLIHRMELAGHVQPNEFHVRSFTEKDEKKVLIVHETTSLRRKRVATHMVPSAAVVRAETLSKHGVPPVEKLVEVIESQPDYVHDLKSLSKLATGVVIDSHTKNVAYRALSYAAQEARLQIMQKHGGKFVEEPRGRLKVYRWVK